MTLMGADHLDMNIVWASKERDREKVERIGEAKGMKD